MSGLDDKFMRRALALAEATGQLGNVPVGAVIVRDGEVLGEGANLRHTLQDPTAHAEILAIREAAMRSGAWRLTDATLFVTLEPCAMCSGAILEARFARVVFGAFDVDTDHAHGRALLDAAPRVDVRGGVLQEDCRDALQRFFSALRMVDP